jgi:GNAT superfamily N-acetyltransferase
VDEPDIRVLAQLHTACLADSFVTALGRGYVESFYRYVTRSDKEIALVERNAAGAIVAATVVSLEPASFTRRLLRHTSLLPHFLLRAPRMLALLLAGPRGVPPASSDVRTDPHAPEMLLIFTAERERGRGIGDALLRRAEEKLRELHVRSYQVRTVLDPANRALAFYRDRGFEPVGTDVRLGKQFQVFARTLD